MPAGRALAAVQRAELLGRWAPGGGRFKTRGFTPLADICWPAVPACPAPRRCRAAHLWNARGTVALYAVRATPTPEHRYEACAPPTVASSVVCGAPAWWGSWLSMQRARLPVSSACQLLGSITCTLCPFAGPGGLMLYLQ
eukprot:gene31338-6488_t